jgi:serine/threonine protein kinase
MAPEPPDPSAQGFNQGNGADFPAPVPPANSDDPDSSGRKPDTAGTSPVPSELAQHPRYRILEILDSGGMGTILKAEHLFLKRHVAVKVLHRKLVTDEKMRQRFIKEMQAAAQLSHPNIVRIYDAEVIGDSSFLVMELVEGIALQKVMSEGSPLPIRQACSYAQQTASGMQHAFECGILHRDIKPNNLMLTPQGVIKILDFGLAGYLTEVAVANSTFELNLNEADPDMLDTEEGVEATGSSMKTIPISPRLTSHALGTPDFLAPEMTRNPMEADVRADIYSLGCTLYLLLTGRVPFPTGGTRYKLHCHCHQEPAPARALRPDIPERLADAITRMMAKSAKDRYATPADVIEVLGPFAASNRGTVLVVDDDPLIQAALTIGLESQGFTVQVAGDGLAALNALRSGPLPQLILLDLKMPGMNGFEFLRERGNDPVLAAIPVVVLTGLGADIADKVAGAVDYLTKPIDPQEIAKQIQRYFLKK